MRPTMLALWHGSVEIALEGERLAEIVLRLPRSRSREAQRTVRVLFHQRGRCFQLSTDIRHLAVSQHKLSIRIVLS